MCFEYNKDEISNVCRDTRHQEREDYLNPEETQDHGYLFVENRVCCVRSAL